MDGEKSRKGIGKKKMIITADDMFAYAWVAVDLNTNEVIQFVRFADTEKRKLKVIKRKSYMFILDFWRERFKTETHYRDFKLVNSITGETVCSLNTWIHSMAEKATDRYISAEQFIMRLLKMNWFVRLFLLNGKTIKFLKDILVLDSRDETVNKSKAQKCRTSATKYIWRCPTCGSVCGEAVISKRKKGNG